MPLSERILAAIPAPRSLIVVIWAAVPWANASANLLLEDEARSAVWEQGRVLVFLNYAALSFAIAITVWGTARIARSLEALPRDTSGAVKVSAEDFRELNSTAIPLLGAAATALAFATSSVVADGLAAGVLRGATWFIVGIAIWTFLTAYVSLNLGLDRIGREPLPAEAGLADPTLGLRPLGNIAFMALWMLLAWLVPLVLTGLPDVVGVIMGLAVLAGALAAFFLSMLRLHRQMAAVRRMEIAVVRELYAEAYEPVRTARTLDVLEGQNALLGAADALEKRAHAIHEWPMDEGTVARVITIATSVVAVIVARLILHPVGL